MKIMMTDENRSKCILYDQGLPQDTDELGKR